MSVTKKVNQRRRASDPGDLGLKEYGLEIRGDNELVCRVVVWSAQEPSSHTRQRMERALRYVAGMEW